MDLAIKRAVDSYITAINADREFRNSLCAAVDALPQNPDIIGFNPSPCTFIISFSSIKASEGLVMNPRYYDFNGQKKTLACVVSDTENYSVMMDKLQDAADKGRIKNDSSFFHPKVKQHVASILSQFSDSGCVSEETGE